MRFQVQTSVSQNWGVGVGRNTVVHLENNLRGRNSCENFKVDEQKSILKRSLERASADGFFCSHVHIMEASESQKKSP
jgi:hypothetical protein